MDSLAIASSILDTHFHEAFNTFFEEKFKSRTWLAENTAESRSLIWACKQNAQALAQLTYENRQSPLQPDALPDFINTSKEVAWHYYYTYLTSYVAVFMHNHTTEGESPNAETMTQASYLFAHYTSLTGLVECFPGWSQNIVDINIPTTRFSKELNESYLAPLLNGWKKEPSEPSAEQKTDEGTSINQNRKSDEATSINKKRKRGEAAPINQIQKRHCNIQIKKSKEQEVIKSRDNWVAHTDTHYNTAKNILLISLSKDFKNALKIAYTPNNEPTITDEPLSATLQLNHAKEIGEKDAHKIIVPRMLKKIFEERSFNHPSERVSRNFEKHYAISYLCGFLSRRTKNQLKKEQEKRTPSVIIQAILRRYFIVQKGLNSKHLNEMGSKNISTTNAPLSHHKLIMPLRPMIMNPPTSKAGTNHDSLNENMHVPSADQVSTGVIHSISNKYQNATPTAQPLSGFQAILLDSALKNSVREELERSSRSLLVTFSYPDLIDFSTRNQWHRRGHVSKIRELTFYHYYFLNLNRPVNPTQRGAKRLSNLKKTYFGGNFQPFSSIYNPLEPQINNFEQLDIILKKAQDYCKEFGTAARKSYEEIQDDNSILSDDDSEEIRGDNKAESRYERSEHIISNNNEAAKGVDDQNEIEKEAQAVSVSSNPSITTQFRAARDKTPEFYEDIIGPGESELFGFRL